MNFNVLLATASLVVLMAALPMQLAAQIPPDQPDQISQLAAMVGLSDEQEAEIRGAIDEHSPEIQQLQAEAQQVQQALEAMVGPDFDEDEIRESASRLGELSGEMTALQLIMQSRIESVFTDEQREMLEEQAMQQQQQQQQQQQELQRQLQEQMQRQEPGE